MDPWTTLRQTDRHRDTYTDHETSVTTGRIYALMRPNNDNNNNKIPK